MAKWFSLIMPVVVLFYQENDLSMTQIFWLKSFYSIGIVAFEIPSGYFADIWGRKKTLIAGTLLTTLGFSFYGFSSHFWEFLIAELTLGIGQSFISGADSAMLYDSLKQDNNEKEYLKYEGRVISVGNFSEAIAGIIGGLLATISLRTPYFGQILVAAIAIPAALTLREPPRNTKRKSGLNDIVNVLKTSLIDNSKLRNFILFSSLIGAATLSFAWFMQPLFIEIGLPLAFFGVIWTILNLVVGFSAMGAHRVERLFSEKQTTGMILIFLSLAFILTGSTLGYLSLGIIFFAYIVRGIATPVLKDYIHNLIDSDVRATVLSLRDMIIRIIFAITGPLWGMIIDHRGLRSGFYISGLFFALTGAVLYYISYFHKTSDNPS